MKMHHQPARADEKAFHKATRRAIRYLPLYLAVPALFWVGLEWAGYGMDWRGFGLGALGWTIALALRGPVSALTMKGPKNRGNTILVLSSGVLEETTRYVLLVLTSLSAGWAASVGQGWAAVEVAFTMVNVVLIAALANKTDEKSRQAKDMLAAQGLLTVHPLVGVLERVSASAFHIGATLIVAAAPWMVVVLIPLHSGLNWGASKGIKRSVPLTELVVAGIGWALLLAGLLLV